MFSVLKVLKVRSFLSRSPGCVKFLRFLYFSLALSCLKFSKFLKFFYFSLSRMPEVLELLKDLLFLSLVLKAFKVPKVLLFLSRSLMLEGLEVLKIRLSLSLSLSHA